MRARTEIAHGRMRRFLHDVAELTGRAQFTAAFHGRRFGRQDLAADFGPRQAGNSADLILLIGLRGRGTFGVPAIPSRPAA